MACIGGPGMFDQLAPLRMNTFFPMKYNNCCKPLSVQVLLSNREEEETISLRSTGLVIKTIPSNETEGKDSDGQQTPLFTTFPILSYVVFKDSQLRIGASADDKNKNYSFPIVVLLQLLFWLNSILSPRNRIERISLNEGFRGRPAFFLLICNYKHKITTSG